MQLTVIGGIPGSEMGVVRGGRLGIPGIVGGAGGGIVIPVKIGGGASTDVILNSEDGIKSSSADEGGGPNIAWRVLGCPDVAGTVGIVGAAPRLSGFKSAFVFCS